MRLINLTITVFLLFVATSTSAQIHTNSIHNCQACTKEAEKDNLKWEKFAKSLEKAPRKIVNTSNGPIYEIPIVVHVLHMGESLGAVNNPTDVHIVNWIEYINAVFDCKWSAYPDENSGGVKVPIRLVLAQRDENCNPTNGITRTNGLSMWPKYRYGMSDTNYAGPHPSQVNYHEVRAKLRWDMGLFYNIIIVNEIADTTKVTGLTGHPESCFGPVIYIESDVAKAGNPEILAELGKAFSLDYTFSGDVNGTACPPSNCLTSGDYVCDTEPHKRGFYSVGCSGTETNPCTGNSINYTDANFMSFSPRSCRNRYTQGQVNRMVYSLNNHSLWRSYLLESEGLYPPVVNNNTCKTDYSVFDTASNSIAGFSQFVFGGIRDFGYNYQHSRKNLYDDRSCWQKAKVYQGRSYPIEVNLGSNNSEHVKIYIDYNNDGKYHSTQELVSSGITSGVYRDTILIPNANVTICKYLQMRVVTERATAPSPGPCTNLQRGQVRDYSVYVSPESISQISVKHIGGTLPACAGDPLQFEATITNAVQGSPIYWDVNNKMALGSLSATVSNHIKDDKVRALLISANHICVTQEDSVFSNAIHVPHKPQNVRPSITKNNGKIVSDIYPVDWHESMSGLLVANSYTAFAPSVTGIYYAYNVDTLGCSSIRSNNLYSFPLDIAALKVDNFDIYPNPAKSYFDITIKNKGGFIQTVSITNSVGQSVALYDDVGTSLRVNTEEWQSGIYFVTIKDANGQKERTNIVVTK